MHSVLGLACLIVVLVIMPEAWSAPAQKKDGTTKHHVTRHWRGYGFLPGPSTTTAYTDTEFTDRRAGLLPR
jgi:hypothetical protein